MLLNNKCSILQLSSNVDFVTKTITGECVQRSPAHAPPPPPNRLGQTQLMATFPVRDTGPEMETSMDEASLEGLAGQLRPRRAAAPCPPSAYRLPHHPQPPPRTCGPLISDSKKPGVPEVHWELISLISQYIKS